MKKISGILLSLTLPLCAFAQQVDTLDAAVATSRTQANYISGGKALRTEVVSSAGLMKMACCNLAESFENSASVTAGLFRREGSGTGLRLKSVLHLSSPS